MRILVRPGEVVGHAVAYGEFEPLERSLFVSLVREEDTVFDIGANFGLYSVIASARLRSGSLHAFEPNPDLFSILKANLEKRPFGHLEAHQIAIGATRGNVAFNCALDSAFSSVVETERIATERTVMVPITTLDGFMEERDIQLVDLMKIDVEGYEPEVLEGASRLLARTDAPIVLIEISQANLKPRKMTQGAVLEALFRHGYDVLVAENRLRPLTDLERSTGQIEAENFLAIKSARRDRIQALAGAA
jgi:FkbM family methyltransferase